MSNGKAIALAVVLFVALMLAAYGLMRLHTTMNVESIAEHAEKARQRISTAVGQPVMLKGSTYDFPWICGTYESPSGEIKHYSYQVPEDRLGLEDNGDVSDYCRQMLRSK